MEIRVGVKVRISEIKGEKEILGSVFHKDDMRAPR